MTVKEFVDGYKEAGNKAQYVGKHIITEYLPYLFKVQMCNVIVNIAYYNEVEDRKIFTMNTPTGYMLFIMGIVKNYTDIEYDDEHVINAFGELDAEKGLVDEIIKNLPDSEYEDLLEIFTSIVDDARSNAESVTAYLETKIQSLIEVIKDMANTDVEGDGDAKDNESADEVKA